LGGGQLRSVFDILIVIIFIELSTCCSYQNDVVVVTICSCVT
jgi:hypothetical protein